MNVDIIDTAHERKYIIKDELVSSKVMKLEEELSDFIRDDDRDITLDLVHISKIDSMSIAVIIRVKNKLSNQGRALKLINPSDGVVRVLELAGLDSYLFG